jgi:predicted TIM-barrel fold metal-dependent hydrolase
MTAGGTARTVTASGGGGGTADAPLLVFSADTHVGPGPQHLRPYCPSAYLPQFDAFAATVEQYNTSFQRRGFSDAYWEGRRRNGLTAGHHDPYARLQDMDTDGVAGGVVFHDSLNGQPFPFEYTNFVGSGSPPPESRELAGVGRALYNRWLADFCSVEPERNIGLAQLPMWDVDAAIAELEWCAEHGLGGVNYPAPGRTGVPLVNDPRMDRFFAACADLDMTLATHIGSNPPSAEYLSADATDESTFHFGLLDAGEWGIRVVYELVIFGVFERHPNLKLVLTEVPGVYWDEICLKMDSLHDTPIRRRDHKLPQRPSEYAATNVWMGNSFQSRHEAVTAIEIGREDRFMWGSDYPHPEGTYSYPETPDEIPMTRLSLAHNYHGLPLDKVRRLLGENALEAFPRLDGVALEKVAARVGLRPAELATAPDLRQHAYIHERGTLAFRSEGPWN